MSNAGKANTFYIVIWFLLLLGLFVIAVRSLIYDINTENHFSYALKKEKYVELKKDAEKNKYPSYFQIELNELGGRNRETWVDAILSFSTIASKLKEGQKFKIKVTSGEYWPVEYKTKGYQKGKSFFSDIFKKIKLSPSSGSHLQFPLEDFHFLISIEIEPHIKFSRIEFYNRTSGLITKEKPNPVLKNNVIEVDFDLRRRRFDQILFYVFAIVSTMYVCLFLYYIKKKIDLTIYVSGFFIALWSIRGIFSFGVKAFPTYLDYVTLCLSVILLVGILTNAIMGRYED